MATPPKAGLPSLIPSPARMLFLLNGFQPVDNHPPTGETLRSERAEKCLGVLNAALSAGPAWGPRATEPRSPASKPEAAVGMERGQPTAGRKPTSTQGSSFHLTAGKPPPQLAPELWLKRGTGSHRWPLCTHVMPISFRSLSVRVRKMRRSTSCSSNSCRYFRHPICSSRVARSWGPE